jgi:hypothetical protein
MTIAGFILHQDEKSRQAPEPRRLQREPTLGPKTRTRRQESLIGDLAPNEENTERWSAEEKRQSVRKKKRQSGKITASASCFEWRQLGRGPPGRAAHAATGSYWAARTAARVNRPGNRAGKFLVRLASRPGRAKRNHALRGICEQEENQASAVAAKKRTGTKINEAKSTARDMEWEQKNPSGALERTTKGLDDRGKMDLEQKN